VATAAARSFVRTDVETCASDSQTRTELARAAVRERKKTVSGGGSRKNQYKEILRLDSAIRDPDS